MHDICRVYAANRENSFMELSLPATDYEMLDMMERLVVAINTEPKVLGVIKEVVMPRKSA